MKADVMSLLPNRTQSAQAIKRPECTKTTKDRSFQRVLQEESGRRNSDATATPEEKNAAEHTQVVTDTNTAKTDVKNLPITESSTKDEPSEETAAQAEVNKDAVLMEMAVGAETIVLPVNVDQKADLIQEISFQADSEAIGETRPEMAQTSEIRSDLTASLLVTANDPPEGQVPVTAFLALPEQKIMDSMQQVQTSVQTADPAIQPVADALNNAAAGTAVSAATNEESTPVLRAADVKTEQAQLSLRAAGTVVQSQETSSSASGGQGKSGSQSKSDKVKSLLDFESRKWSGQKLPSSAAVPTDEASAAREVRSDPSMLIQRSESLSYTATAAAEQTVKADLQAASAEVDTNDIMEQIVRKAELMVKQNSSQVKIELQPEFLGKLTIKVVMEEGAVTAKFITDNHQVKQMLESNINLLKQSLEAQGMRVERAEVNVQLNNGGLFDGSEGNRQWMWNQQNQHHNPGMSPAESEILEYGPSLQDAESYTSNYGIQANGSMNFLV